MPRTSRPAHDVSHLRPRSRRRDTVPAKDGRRAGDLLNRDFTAAEPNRVWVTDFTYARTWAGFVYVAFIVDVFAQRIVARHASTSEVTDLVTTPLRMALWQRDRECRPAIPGHRHRRRRLRQGPHETINGLYKTECIRTRVFHDGPYKAIADVEYGRQHVKDPWHHTQSSPRSYTWRHTPDQVASIACDLTEHVGDQAVPVYAW